MLKLMTYHTMRLTELSNIIAQKTLLLILSLVLVVDILGQIKMVLVLLTVLLVLTSGLMTILVLQYLLLTNMILKILYPLIFNTDLALLLNSVEQILMVTAFMTNKTHVLMKPVQSNLMVVLIVTAMVQKTVKILVLTVLVQLN